MSGMPSDKVKAVRVGVVLAGGQSRRMGTDKALMRFGGERLIDRAIARLSPQVDRVFLNRATDPGDINPQIELVADRLPGFQGPLAGIHAALAHADDLGLGHFTLFTVPVDSPYFPTDLVARLDQARAAPVAFAASQGQRHPVFGRWPPSALETIEQALAKGNRRIDRVANSLGFCTVEWQMGTDNTGQALDPFLNVNTSGEFDALTP